MDLENSLQIDKDSFYTVWEKLVVPAVKIYCDKYSLDVLENALEVVWHEYKFVNSYCKIAYMKNPEKKIDRHKVCSCYIIAILNANILSCPISQRKNTDNFDVFNERLALTVGLSLLRAFLETDIKKSSMTEEEKKVCLSRISDGMQLPQCNLELSYRQSFETELHYVHKEGNLNVLSLSNELFLLEVFSLGDAYKLLYF